MKQESLIEQLPQDSFVHSLLGKARTYVSSGMPFFPEYTCHNMNHIDATLSLARKLIPDEMLDNLDSEAIELIVAAILLHDLGMFIQEDGLDQLIFGAGKEIAIDHIDVDAVSGEKLAWGKAWERYYTEVRRYPQQRIDFEFGLDADGEKINISQLKPDKIEMKYAKIYGGFLRRYHPRLAQDIAMNGFIGTDGNRDDILSGAKDYQRNLIGITARSHGMNLRDTESFLRIAFPTRPDKPHGIPIYYLMAILRMADYLHAGEKRAPKERQLAQAVVTPSSLHEIAWNQAVYDNMSFDIKHRQIYIDTKPESSKVFLALEKWLNDVQRELDLSWAVLDEKYRGEYRLSIHRIVADVFNETKKNEWRKSFLPRKAQLSVNPEIVKLMIAPLYGNEPSYGVRELLQNAIDACNEREEIEHASGRDYTGEITVEVDIKNRKLTITDNGVGMSEDVLINYFLTVGASYRRSESWIAQHTNEDGKSRVVRSGRFGVGVMASFLLGETVTVTTRHHKDDRGYHFSFSTESEVLNVVRTKEITPAIGTTISIDISENAVKKLGNSYRFHQSFPGLMDSDMNFLMESFSSHDIPSDWTDWYHMSQPLVTYTLNGYEQSKEKKEYIDNDRLKWFHFESTSFDSVRWSLEGSGSYWYSWMYGYNRTMLFCNGIKIDKPIFAPKNEGYIDSSDFGYSIFPLISICDKNGALDLSLKRDSVNSFPETKELLYDVYASELARILALKHQREQPHNKQYFDLIYNRYGFTLNQRTFLLHATYEKLFIVFCNEAYSDCSTSFGNLDVCYNIVNSSDYDSILEIGGQRIEAEFGHSDSRVYNVWYIEAQNWSIPIIDLWNTLEREYYSHGNGIWHITPNGGGPKLPAPHGLTPNHTMPLIIEFGRLDPEIPERQNIMLEVLKTHLPHQGHEWDGWIPHALEDRVKRYPNAFVELFKYMPKDNQSEIWKLLADINLTPLEN